MNFPIPVNLTVAQNNVPVNITVSDNSESIGLDIETQIVASIAEEYEGPYSVTPTESAQTLQTQGKNMLDNVTVEAMPEGQLDDEYTITHYIPNMTVSSTGLVTVNENVHKYITPVSQSGYLASSAVWQPALSVYGQKQIDSAVYQNYPAFSVVPEVGITDNGLVWGVVNSAETNFHPIKTNGWATTNDNMPVAFWGTKDKQLDTVDGTTITPTESEQTAVPAKHWTKGEVKVAAIPSDYIGSEVPQKSSSDMTTSGATVTAPAGYYAESASASVPNATWKNASTVGVVPEISVDANGLITANCAGWTSIHPLTSSGYADADTAANIQLSGVKTSQLSTQAAQTITPTTADQTIDSGKYLTGAQTIKGDANLIAENIKKDVTIFNVVGTHEGGLPEDTLLKALRNQTTSVEDDTLTNIRSYGLAYMTALESVSFPNLQTINAYAFYNDYAIDFGEGWPFPKAKTIGNYAFRYCYGLTGDIVLPSTVTSIGQYTFANCDHMTSFTATGSITTLGTYTFIGASGHVMALREIHMPNLGTSIALNSNFGSTTAANACQHLEVCDIGKAKSIAANTFANCYKLQTLIIRRTSVTTCANVSAFLNTPLRGGNSLTAKIYVPEALIDSYKAASVWSTIDGYGYVEWCKIEGSEYEL